MSENSKDENAVETSYSKGENFEKLFAEFLKSDLGWDKYVIRSQQKGKANSKGSQVDIIAEKKDKRGKKLYDGGVVFFVLFVSLFLLAVFLLSNGDINEGDGTGLIIFSFILGGGAIYFLYDSSHYHKENAWVECKNRKTKSTYEDVKKSIDEYKDYKASGDKEYKYVAHYFVSANGFVDNALKLAEDNGIISYQLKDGKFEIAKRWQ